MKKELDKFYTKKEVAKECLSTLHSYFPLSSFFTIIEPSCGNGSFMSYLPHNTIGLDISPDYEGAIEQDFYTYTLHNKQGRVLTVGNPPFGIGGKDAVAFFKHATLFSDVIAFIVPRTFKRISIQNRLPFNFHLVYQRDIKKGSFIPESMQARCVFQIWEKRSEKRKKIILLDKHEDFIFVKQFKDATIAIKAYGGSGDCGTVITDFSGKNKKAYHCIKCTPDIIQHFKHLNYYPLASDTVRQDSIGQKELIFLYTEKYGKVFKK